MKKHIWAYYEPLDYRALADKLDEMAQAGWQLTHLGFCGLTFTEALPQSVYHRVIRSPWLSGESIPQGWTFLLRQGDRTIITRAQPLNEAERLLEDQEMTYWGRQQRNVVLYWVLIIGLYVGDQALRLQRYGSLTREEWALNGGMALVAALYLAECVCWQVNAWAYWRAVRQKQLYEPPVKCRGLRLAGLAATALCLGGTLALGWAFLC